MPVSIHSLVFLQLNILGWGIVGILQFVPWGLQGLPIAAGREGALRLCKPLKMWLGHHFITRTPPMNHLVLQPALRLGTLASRNNLSQVHQGQLIFSNRELIFDFAGWGRGHGHGLLKGLRCGADEVGLPTLSPLHPHKWPTTIHLRIRRRLRLCCRQRHYPVSENFWLRSGVTGSEWHGEGAWVDGCLIRPFFFALFFQVQGLNTVAGPVKKMNYRNNE